MTPRELNITAKAYQKRKIEEFKEEITIAYLNSYWTIAWLGKRHQQPRPLKEILNSIGRERKIMTDEQMLERVKALNAILGGEVKVIGSS